ncbi:MAG TPA: cupredoxin domain-containing protein [Actinomycetota bacterium]|nr:cupredoxin domain-containing protein [Actinomycetota bacterium]
MRSTPVRLMLLVVCVTAVVGSAFALQSDPAPYVVTAIDYHFHDAHPTLPIGAGRALVVKNEGRNVHNVTVDALGFSRDVRPGARLTIDDISDRLAPGRYVVMCRYHVDRGMTGTIVIAE